MTSAPSQETYLVQRKILLQRLSPDGQSEDLKMLQALTNHLPIGFSDPGFPQSFLVDVMVQDKETYIVYRHFNTPSDLNVSTVFLRMDDSDEGFWPVLGLLRSIGSKVEHV